MSRSIRVSEEEAFEEVKKNLKRMLVECRGVKASGIVEHQTEDGRFYRARCHDDRRGRDLLVCATEWGDLFRFRRPHPFHRFVRSELARERSEGANVETMGLVIVMVGDVGDVAPKDAMEGIELLPGQVEFFVASDFYSFKPGHEKCPLRFDILNEKETRSVVSRYVGKDGDVTKFPTIGKTDELARYYGLRAGEMARIISDMTHPPSVRYDVCVDRSS